MEFEKKLKDPEFLKYIKSKVDFDKFLESKSPEELLNLSEGEIGLFDEEKLSIVMKKIMIGSHHLTLDDANRTSFDPRWKKYLEIAWKKIEE